MSRTLTPAEPSTTRLRTLARVEIAKIARTRAVQVFTGVMLGMGVLFSVEIIRSGLRSDTGVVDLGPSTGGALLIIGFVSPILGVMIAATDWKTRAISTLFLIEPRRRLILIAKVLASVLLSAALTMTVLAVLLLVAVTAATLAGYEINADGLALWVGGMLLVSMHGALVGSAIAALLMSTTWGILVVLAATFVADGFLGFLPYGVGSYLQMRASLLNVAIGGSILPAVTSILVWIVIPLLVADWRWRRREV